jgi:2-methylcitrate dehydratase PrpD
MATLLEQIADYAVREQTSKLPKEAVHHAKRAVIDWHASLLPGSRVAPATLLEQALADELDHGRARLASGRRATIRAAAVINGAASHSIEFDDIWRDGGYHPASPVISATLAAAQSQGSTGEQFLRGVIVGYEVSTRIAEAIMPSHYNFWHTTGTAGTFGAAAGVATILCCDREQFMNAIGNAGTFAAGLQQAFRSESMGNPLHGGHAAEAGALAALGASKGVTGAHDILEGDVGFGAAMSVKPDWSLATRGLGADYHITRVTFKNHGCCGHSFSGLDAVLELKSRHGFSHRDVRKVRIATYKAGLDVIDNPAPEGSYQAKFSMQYTAAHALVYGSVRLDAFGPDRLGNPDIRALMKKVECVADPDLSKGYPRQRAAMVVVELTNGRRFEHFQDTRKGDPELPFSDNDLDGKYLELTTPVLGDAGARALLKDLWAIETLKNVEFHHDGRSGRQHAR